MTISELKEELGRRMQDVKSHKLWQTAFQVARDFRTKKVTENSDTTTESFDLKIRIGTICFRVVISPYHYGHLQIFVDANGEIVFSAREVKGSNNETPWVEKEVLDLCTMDMNKEYRQHDNTRVRVERYVPGEWLQSFKYSVFVEAFNTFFAERAAKEAKAKMAKRQNR